MSFADASRCSEATTTEFDAVSRRRNSPVFPNLNVSQPQSIDAFPIRMLIAKSAEEVQKTISAARSVFKRGRFPSEGLIERMCCRDRVPTSSSSVQLITL